MALAMEEVVSMASAVFSQDIINTMEEAGFTIEDVTQLTRDDIDQEFKDFRFGERKRLWIFFKSLKSASSNLQSNTSTPASQSHVIDNIPNMNREFHSPERRFSPFEVKEVPESSNVTIGESNESHEDNHHQSIQSDSSECDRISPPSPPNYLPSIPSVPYPGNILPPFPLSTSLQEEISCISKYDEDVPLFHKFVREVYLTLREALCIVPSKNDLKETACMLCMEYPVVRGEGEETWMPLYVALRRRMNRYESGHTSLHSILDEYSSPTVVEVIQSQAMPPPVPDQQKEDSNLMRRLNNKLRNGLKPYPGDIPWPFPLKDPLRNFLLSGNDPLKEMNRKVFKELVREITGQTEGILGRRPDKEEGRRVIENLCVEYPTLCLGGQAYCPPLRIAVTKRYNNLDLKRRREQQQQSLLESQVTEGPLPKRSKKNDIRLSRPLRHCSWRGRVKQENS